MATLFEAAGLSDRAPQPLADKLRPETLDVMSLYGILKPSKRGVSLQDMEEAISHEARGE